MLHSGKRAIPRALPVPDGGALDPAAASVASIEEDKRRIPKREIDPTAKNKAVPSALMLVVADVTTEEAMDLDIGEKRTRFISTCVSTHPIILVRCTN
jgi:hypothetical protein